MNLSKKAKIAILSAVAVVAVAFIGWEVYYSYSVDHQKDPEAPVQVEVIDTVAASDTVAVDTTAQQ